MSMAWVAVGTAVVGAGVSAKNSSDANKAAGEANDKTLAQQASLTQQQRNDMAPYSDIGLAAIPEYKRMLAGEEMKLSAPGQWQLGESAKMMSRQDAARGLSGSGGSVARYGDLASKVYANDYNDQYNRIFQAIGIGQNSAAGQATATGQLSSNVGQAGANQMNNIYAEGQNQSDFYSGLGGAAMGAANLYQQNKAGADLFKTGSTPSSGGGVTSGIGSSNKTYSLMP